MERTKRNLSLGVQRPKAAAACRVHAGMVRCAALLLAIVSGCGGPSSTGGTTTARPKDRESHEDPCKADPAACRAVPRPAACAIDDMRPESEGEQTLLRNIARECSPADQCVLECIRSGCAYGIGGGCFHACGVRAVPLEQRDAVLLDEAAKYRSGTNYLCRYRKPGTGPSASPPAPSRNK